MGPLRAASPLVVLSLAGGLLGVSCGGTGRERGKDLPAGPSSAVDRGAGLGALSDDPLPSPTPQPVWVPPGTFACPLGHGDRNASCAAGPAAVFAAEVDAAVDQVLREQPSLFEGGDAAGRILDEEPFHLAVARLLQARGLCSGWDIVDLQVRNSAGFSEQYDLFDHRARLREPGARFRSTCTPASFPLAAAERIEAVRVGFYGITCDDGRTPPRNGEGRLPLGCTGYVTVTPKDANNDDVDRRVHGPYVTWELEQRGEYVRVVDFPDVAFNKILRPETRGDFQLCATVQTHKSCLEGRVTAN